MAGSPSPNWEQAHVDIGALAQRVTGLEAGVQDIRGAISALSIKLDGKPTNWYGVAGAVGVLVTIIGGGVGFLITPINSDLGRHERDISHISETAVNRSDYLRDRDETERWLGSLRDRIGDSVAQRQLTELKERLDERYKITQDVDKVWFERIMNRVDAIDAQLVKRPELQASQDGNTARINTIAGGLHEIQTQIEAFSPPSHVIEQIQRELSELRMRGISPPPPTPGR